MTLAALVPLSIVLVAAGALAAFGVRFHKRQNSGALGGAMSRAKAYWLPFAIWFWFVVCPVVAFDDVVAASLRTALGAFGVFMWMRGAAEMVMLYATKNWRPPIGITHDACCIVVVLAILLWNAGAVAAAVAARDVDRWALGLCVAVVVSLVVEMHHAYSFFVAVRGRTTGEEGVWFADDEQERFRQINRNTFRWNVVLTVVVVAFRARYFAGAA
jgi:hypothetical protein